jgi:predicted AAA+ superfamily ATPase
MTGLPRFLKPPSSHFFLFGPRGTGKTTWLRQQFPSALWLDLLDPALERQLAARPETLRELVHGQTSPDTVVIDEVQRAPGLLTVVHSLIEDKVPGRRFVLTGSSARKLRRAGVDLLGGRAVRLSMHPFLAAELGSSFQLDRALSHGLVPGILGATDPQRALQAYLGLYIREEVKAEGLVRNLDSFSRFLEVLSLSHGSPLNLANIARDCEARRSTVEGHLEVLEDLLLAFRLPVFQKRAKRQVTSHPKFYWFDAGVFRSIRPAGPLDRSTEIDGSALEGLVAQHLRAWIDLGDGNESLYFWRTRAGSEVDFVVYGRTGFWGVEVKNARRVDGQDLRGLQAFRDEYPEATCLLLHRGSPRLRIDGILCVPVEEFLAGIRPGAALPV